MMIASLRKECEYDAEYDDGELASPPETTTMMRMNPYYTSRAQPPICKKEKMGPITRLAGAYRQEKNAESDGTLRNVLPAVGLLTCADR